MSTPKIMFGTSKSTRSKKIEKYPDTPVMTMLEVEEGQRSRKFELNDKAIEVLGLVPGESFVAISLAMNNQLGKTLIADVTTVEDAINEGFSLKKQKTFANSPMYKAMLDAHGVEEGEAYEFELKFEDALSEEVGYSIATIVPILEKDDKEDAEIEEAPLPEQEEPESQSEVEVVENEEVAPIESERGSFDDSENEEF